MKSKPKLKPCGPPRLIIIRCPVHDFWGVEIGDMESGHRLTPSKCCGSWHVVKAWNLDAVDWQIMANLARSASRRAGRGKK